MKNIDVLVVGGSFAGLECARVAARARCRVTLWDPKPEAGAGVRTTGLLTPEALADLTPPRYLTRPIDGVRLYSPRLRSVDLESGGYRYYATDTPALLRWMANRAVDVGAELMWGERFLWARRDGDGIRAGDHRARYLVGADGARSRVATTFGLGHNRRFLFGAEWEFEGLRGIDENRLHCFLSREFAPGYLGWAVPGLGVTQIGVAGTAPFHPRLEAFVERLSKLFDFGRARVIARRAGWIPVGGTVSPADAPKVLLIGDAAGHVSPLTAGGIRLALQGAAAAGAAIAEFLRGKGTAPAAGLGVDKTRFHAKSVFRWLLEKAFSDGMAETLIDLAAARKWASDIFFSPRGLPAPGRTRPPAPATWPREFVGPRKESRS